MANGKANGQKSQAQANGGGCPTKLTVKLQDAICTDIALGSYPLTAARANGVPERTWYDWLAWGRDGKQPWAQLSQAIEKAEAAAEEHALKYVRKAMPTCWTAAMTFLERRHPDRWGRREHLTHEGGKEPLTVKVETRGVDELRAALDAAIKLGRDAIKQSRERPDDASADA